MCLHYKQTKKRLLQPPVPTPTPDLALYEIGHDGKWTIRHIEYSTTDLSNGIYKKNKKYS